MIGIGRELTKEEIAFAKDNYPNKKPVWTIYFKDVPRTVFNVRIRIPITKEEIYIAYEKKGVKREDLIIE